MKTRVIKFSLVGFIFVILLIIAIIVGLIIYMPKIKEKINGGNNAENNTNSINNEIKDNNKIKSSNEIVEVEEYVENITVNGANEQIIMKYSEGTYGYRIKYDIASFYTDKDVNGVDQYDSLVSNTIFMYISKKDGKFDDEATKLLNNGKSQKSNVTETQINGKSAVIEEKTNSTSLNKNYYIKKDENSYYVIQVNCGLSYVEMMTPRIEKMIQSFEIIE